MPGVLPGHSGNNAIKPSGRHAALSWCHKLDNVRILMFPQQRIKGESQRTGHEGAQPDASTLGALTGHSTRSTALAKTTISSGNWCVRRASIAEKEHRPAVK